MLMYGRLAGVGIDDCSKVPRANNIFNVVAAHTCQPILLWKRHGRGDRHGKLSLLLGVYLLKTAIRVHNREGLSQAGLVASDFVDFERIGGVVDWVGLVLRLDVLVLLKVARRRRHVLNKPKVTIVFAFYLRHTVVFHNFDV